MNPTIPNFDLNEFYQLVADMERLKAEQRMVTDKILRISAAVGKEETQSFRRLKVIECAKEAIKIALNVTFEQMTMKSSKAPFPFARNVFARLLTTHSSIKLAEVALMCNRTHSVFVIGRQQLEIDVRLYPEKRQSVEKIENIFHTLLNKAMHSHESEPLS